MASLNFFLSLFICCFFLFSIGIQASGLHHHHHHQYHHHHHRHHHGHESGFRPKRLFVFGDSYADTGNIRKAFGDLAYNWHEPYGMSFPGKPTGRFSDGHILTDFIARFLGLRTPWAYQWRKMVGMDKLSSGMNFAYGGSGVFDTEGTFLPNMSVQIDLFEKLLDKSVYTKQDLKSSIAYVSCAGNDYAAWLEEHPNEPIEDILDFIPLVVDELGRNLKRIHDLGIPKVLVTALQPIGCSPRITQSNQFKECSWEENFLVRLHNFYLDRALVPFNNVTIPNNSTIYKLELYNSFKTVIDTKGNPQVNVKFENPLLPACFGVDDDHYCGDRDENGNKLYGLRDPQTSFYWDASHPTQMGWKAIFKHLEPGLTKFLNL